MSTPFDRSGRGPAPAGRRPLAVFLVDDSTTARLGLTRLLEASGEARVVGQASGGRAALRQIPATRPDVVLMDVSMPGLDGLETTRRLMAEHPVPIVLFSELVGRRAELDFQALEAGALDLLRKPARAELDDPERQASLVRRLRVLAEVPLVTRRRRSEPARPVAATSPLLSPPAPTGLPKLEGPLERISIGASTGGPVALATLLAGLAAQPAWPIAIVQHMSAGFVGGLASWLETTLRLPVAVVTERCLARPGHVYLAGDDRHLVWEGPYLRTRETPQDVFHRPSIDVLFQSAALAPRPGRHAGVLLTGMGSDGAEGLLALRSAGGLTLGQSAESCVVYGMPRAAHERGAVDRLLPLDEIAALLTQLPTS